MTRVDASYLGPLFELVEAARDERSYRPMPPPSSGSSLARDDTDLGPWAVSTLVRQSMSAAIGHADGLRLLVIHAKELGVHAPWTLLRGCLESSSVALWLLTGRREERQVRALRLWAEDMRNRGQHEDDSRWVAPEGAQSGASRRQEILELAERLGVREGVSQRVSTQEVIRVAAEGAGLSPVTVRAAWRAASGFAHGRYWPNVRLGEVAGAAPTIDGALVAVVLDHGQLGQLSDFCCAILKRAGQLYAARV